ncbi:thioredoxin family protein [Kitasatospora sp. NPDC088346]|uniref:thioredoxin family protein n=1 Tax=Kitasatospora sp. NPDC088346 TaxID=3364073 RepID=UPI00380F796C
MRRSRALFATTLAGALLSAGCASTAGVDASSGTATAPVTASGAATPAASAASAAPAAPAAAPAASASAAPSGPALPAGYDPKRDAAADIKAALALSAEDHRQVLLDFGADWCPDCKVLERLFRSPEVEPVLRDRYRVVSVDVGQFDHNVELALDYVDLRTSGIPALVVLSPDGKVLTATSDGAFANARTMKPPAVAQFLNRWATA